MTDSAERLRSYIILFSRFGLSGETVERLHWSGPVPEAASVPQIVASTVDESERTPSNLYERAHRLLAASPKGIDVPREYEESTVESELDDLLEQYDTAVSIEEARDETPDESGTPFEISVTDAAGETRTTTFAYPDRPLGDDNLPALLYEIETELLSDTGMTFALLTDRDDETWRAVFLSEDRLDALRDEYGDRITFMDEPLLDETQPEDYAEPISDDGNIFAEEDQDAPAWLSGDDAGDAFDDVGFEPATVEEREDESAETIDEEGIEEAFADMETTTGGVEARGGPSPDVEDLVGDEVGAGSTDGETAGAATSDEKRTESSIGEDRKPAETASSPPTVAPGDEPEPAVTPIGVSPADSPSAAIDEIAVTPTLDPEPAVARIEPPEISPTSENPVSATDEIAVTPGQAPQPALEPVAAGPEVTPSDETTPVVEEHRISPGEETTGALAEVGTAPADEPEPAVHPTGPETEVAEAASPSVTPAENPEPAIRAAASPSDEPDVTPTDGKPIPAVVAHEPTSAKEATGTGGASGEAEPEGMEAAAESPAGAGAEAASTETQAADEAETEAAPAEIDLGSEASARADTDSTEVTTKSEAEGEVDDAASDAESQGPLGRFATWLKGLF